MFEAQSYSICDSTRSASPTLRRAAILEYSPKPDGIPAGALSMVGVAIFVTLDFVSVRVGY